LSSMRSGIVPSDAADSHTPSTIPMIRQSSVRQRG
jgi:hypothetical protein